MTAGSEATSSGTWLDAARDVLDRIGETQSDAIATVAGWCAASIGQDRLVHVFGSGHSRIPVEELFPRYGSFPGFHPMAELSMTFHTQVVGANGQRQAMFIERTEGLAEVILSNFHLTAGDVLIVFSVSGTSAVPIEMAIHGRRQGLRVAAATSVEHSRRSDSLHSSGTRLLDHADVVIDLCTPAGDAGVAIAGLDTPVGPLSTVAATAVANMIKVDTAELLAASGRLPAVLTSSVLVGAERSRALFDEAYADYGRRLAGVIGGGAA